MASWQQTRKVNNDELLVRVKNTVGAWKSGTFLQLVCRPFSINSYCYSKVWFCTHSLDLRVCDIKAISSACKGWLYQDMLEKPSELLLNRPVEEGGLGLHHLQSKALASLITTFLQTAVHPSFQQSLYHSLLYRRHCLSDTSVPDIELPPYYSRHFSNIIKEVIEDSPLNPVRRSVRDWYRYLLERDVTMVKIDEDGRMEKKKCKVEEEDPASDWNLCHRLSRLKGLSPQVKSFNFKLLHRILPCKERLSQLLPATRPYCSLCPNQTPDSLLHSFFDCVRNREAAQYLLHLTRVYHPGIIPDQPLKLQFPHRCHI